MVRKGKPVTTTEAYEETLQKQGTERYVLRLYIAGTNPRSQAAVENIRMICDEYLDGRYDLEVIDIYQDRTRNPDDLVIAAPTLIRKLPLPLRRIIGDMRKKEKVLVGLDLVTRPG
ncbi:MAG: circadian clock KaiB family protein [Methanomicrobiales archaeon]|nr:circadian clock KaiB family protein [Methanomicrobiales archaeon]